MVSRAMGGREPSGHGTTRIRLQPLAEKVHDPLGDAEMAAGLIQDLHEVGRKPTGWMQGLVGRGRSPIRARQHGSTVYDGRACCYEHLRAYEGRPNMQLPLTTTCPQCHSRFEIRMRAVTI